MANVKISQLPQTSVVCNNALIPLVQNGVTCSTYACNLGASTPAIFIAGSGCNSSIRCGVGNTASGAYSSALSGKINCNTGVNSNIGGGSINIVGYYDLSASTCLTTSSYVYCANSATNSLYFYGDFTADLQVGNCLAYFNCYDNKTYSGVVTCSTYSGNYTEIKGICAGSCSGYICTPITNLSCVTSSGVYSNILNGTHNNIYSSYSTISNGYFNTICSNYSFIGSGCCNTASTYCSSILAGDNNTATGSNSSILSGNNNTASNTNSSVAGGAVNIVSGAHSAILSGVFNTNSGNCSIILGGTTNNISVGASGGTSTIAAGCNNSISGYYNVSSFIGGGNSNTINSGVGGILTGSSNLVSGYYSAIGTGTNNVVSDWISFIGGGQCNLVSICNSFIGAGCLNVASTCCNIFIGAGKCNTVSGESSSVVSGKLNSVNGCQSFVGSGELNRITVSAYGSHVGGGICNRVCAYYSSITGGAVNQVCSTAPLSTISGGYCNIITGSFSSVAGGRCNIINGSYSGGGGCNVTNDCNLTFQWNCLRASNLIGTTVAVCVGTDGILVRGTSDMRCKTDITPISYGLNEVSMLKPVSFNWCDDIKSKFGDNRQVGFIAQEVEKVIPEAVGQSADGTYSMDINKIVPALVKSVQEMKSCIDELKNSMKNTNSSL